MMITMVMMITTVITIIFIEHRCIQGTAVKNSRR